jgi:hypothetical protein
VTRLPASIDALVTMFTGAGINTIDGPKISGDYSNAVWIGYDGDGESTDFRSATIEQQWAGLGQRVRNERFDIQCSAYAIDGDGSVKSARDAVFALVAQVESTLRGNPSLGLSSPCVAQYALGDLFTEPLDKGVQCRVPFTVSVETRS